MRLTMVLLSLFLFCYSHGQSLKIAFGSCSDQEIEEQLWAEIADEVPDLFILAGDNIYADKFNETEVRAAYAIHKGNPDFKRILAQTPIIGVWDDHDFGSNDAGRNNVRKDINKAPLLDFFDFPESHAIRSRPGVYHNYLLNQDELDIKVIMLDTRYFRDSLYADTLSQSRYLVNEDGQILGETQWQWFEKELKNSTADINIIVSSIQIIAEDHYYEKWANFPKERTRFLELLQKYGSKNFFLLSGDRHIAEVSKLELPGLSYPLYDFTSSGLSHTWSEWWDDPNSHRVGELVMRRNYGLLEISKNGELLQITFSAKGHQNQTFLKHSVKFSAP